MAKEKQIDKANYKLAGRCEHCGGKEIDANLYLHNELCPIELRKEITDLKTEIMMLQAKIGKQETFNRNVGQYTHPSWTDAADACTDLATFFRNHGTHVRNNS